MSQIDSQPIPTGKKKEHQSIDEKHQEMMNVFKLIEEHTIPQLEKEVDDLQNCTHKITKKTEEYYEMKEKMKNKKREIIILRQKKKKYLLDNAKYIFHYYEDKQKTSTGYNVKDTSTINHFFKIKGKNDESSDINSEKYKQSKKLYQEYWKNVNGEIPNLQDYILSCHNCLICNQGELIPLEEEGVLICNNVELSLIHI